jgi:hypothetical protein
MDAWSIGANIVTGVLVAIPVGVFSARMALRQFRAQRATLVWDVTLGRQVAGENGWQRAKGIGPMP